MNIWDTITRVRLNEHVEFHKPYIPFVVQEFYVNATKRSEDVGDEHFLLEENRFESL